MFIKDSDCREAINNLSAMLFYALRTFMVEIAHIQWQDMDSSQSCKDSYSFLKWRGSIAHWIGTRYFPMQKLTEGGRGFVNLDGQFVIYSGVPGIVVMIFSEWALVNIVPEWNGVVGGISILLFVSVMLYVNYMLFPYMARIAHNRGYINDTELQVALKRRIPKSIFLDPMCTPDT